MKQMQLFCGLFLSCFFLSAGAQEARVDSITGGVLVYPVNSHPAAVVKLEVLNENIIRVVASPLKTPEEKMSLVVLPQSPFSAWRISREPDKVKLVTTKIRAEVNILNGAVAFYDQQGKKLLEEEKGGRSFIPVMHEGKTFYSVQQYFRVSEDDTYFGLGQHQDDLWNYKNRQVLFFQNNTEIAVPFLHSLNRYGILWDNYSLGKAGDLRPFRPLSSLKLFDKSGQQGWLTATYLNDRHKPDDILFEKAESDIWYPYINDTKQKLPAAFRPEKGKISWTGSLETAQTGQYQFRFTYGGYFRFFVNGQLLADKWRMAWNPGTALVDLLMEAGKKYAVQIEWIPDGNESYISASFLPPAEKETAALFGFEAEAARYIDYYFVFGQTPDEVISGYRRLTGKAPIVPRWAMGFWQSRERYKTQEELLQTVAEFRKRNIPLDNIVQDWFYWKENEWGSQDFDPGRFPSPDSMIRLLHEKYRARIMISVWPKFYEGLSIYDQFHKNGWLYTRNIADRQKDWVGPGYVSTFYDVFNAKARKAFWELLNKKIYSRGIDAWWMDASEPDIHSNVSPEKRKQQMQPLHSGTAAEYLNAYPLLNAQGIYEGQRQTDTGKRVFLLTRSAFAGSQRYAASVWSGDIGARWEDMRTQITAGLNYSLSGLPYWTMDIGGFATEQRYNKVPMEQADLDEWRELQTRWYQWGSFLPLFRSHGQFPYRELFHIAPEEHPAYQSMLYYNKLRYRLLPYTYSLAGMAYHRDYTIMRALAMDFYTDKRAVNVADQFLLGPSLMVCPVYTCKASGRQVYLPAGQGWYDFYTGNFFSGGQAIQAAAPYEKVPVFVKEGSVIPAGPALQYSDEKPADPLQLHIYTGKDATFTLYEDEGVNYNYEKGRFSMVRFHFNQAENTLTVSDREGSFNGMKETRTFLIKVISAARPAGLDFGEKNFFKKIIYRGKRMVIRLDK